MTVDEIDPSLLPSVPYVSRKTLPRISAVYFALSAKDAVLYIGQTTDLHTRWAAHQRCILLEQMGCTRISYYACPYTVLLSTEEALIQRLQPPLNAPWYTAPKQVKVRPKKPKQVIQPLRFPLTRAADILGISHWTLRRMIHDGKVPFIQDPSGRLFLPAAWVHAQAQLPHTKEG